MYAKGMSTGDIESHIRDIYGVEVSDTTVSRITDKILPIAKEWQQPSESVYAVVFLDTIHYHVRCEGQIVKKAVYIAIGINLNGKKDVLGMWVGENESAKFWATVLNGLRGTAGRTGYLDCLHRPQNLRETAVHVIAMSVLVLNLRKIQCALSRLLSYLLAIFPPKE